MCSSTASNAIDIISHATLYARCRYRLGLTAGLDPYFAVNADGSVVKFEDGIEGCIYGVLDLSDR